MKVTVNKTCATVSGAEMLTSGTVGKTIDVEFSAEWNDLIKIAVFTNGATTRDVLDPDSTIFIPWEVLATPNKRVSVGFYGYTIEDGEKVLAIPTIWAELGAVRAGADPSGDPSNPPSPEVAEQILAIIGDLENLDTEDKENLVAAINDAYNHGGGGGGTSDHTQLENRDAANQHPMSAISGLEDALDGKGTYSKPSGGIPKTDLASAVQESLGRADSALQTAPVSSVNGKIGAVNLVPADLGIGSVFQLKGSKPTYAALPASGNVIGDVWYVVADSVGYIWLNDGTVDRWEQLGMDIDLSAYRTASAQDVIDNGKQSKITASGILKGDGNGGVSEAIASDIEAMLATDVEIIYGNFSSGDVIDALYYGKSSVQPSGLADYVAIEQGVSEAGKFLVVGDDGNVTTMALAEWQGGSY